MIGNIIAAWIIRVVCGGPRFDVLHAGHRELEGLMSRLNPGCREVESSGGTFLFFAMYEGVFEPELSMH